MYEVVAVNLKTKTVRFLTESPEAHYDNAEAFMKMAIARRGLEVEFYAVVPYGLYKDGDHWAGGGEYRQTLRKE